MDGSFQFTIPTPSEETIVEASYIGYLTQIQTITQTSGVAEVNFTLPLDALQMDEVVVTGVSAATTKRQLGNSISTVNARDLVGSGSPAIDRALSGKFAGVLVQQNSGNPAGGITVRLRGAGTILGNAEPLYIIDGVIVNNDSPELVYLGGYAQNRLVDLNPADIERIEIVKGAAAAALYGSRANNGVVQIFTKRGTFGAPKITFSSRLITDKIRKTLKVNMHPYDADGNPVTRYDHQDVIFRRAFGNEQYLSVAGGAGDTRYYASGAYFQNQGIIQSIDFKRMNLRLRFDQVLTDWANLSVGASYSVSDGDELPNGGLGDLYGALDGFIFGPNTYDARPDPETGEYSDEGKFANPAEVIDKYDFKQKTDRFIGNLHLILTPLPGLSVGYTFGYDGYTQVATGFVPPGTATPSIYQYGWSRRATRTFLQANNDLNIRYQKQLSPIFASTTLLGGTMQYENAVTFSAQSYDLSPVSQIVTSGANQSISEYRSERVIYGLFAQETFGMADRIFITAASRLDASSVFGENERLQFFPKASASYILSEENFWQNMLGRIVPEFKVRAAWGQSGGLTAIGPFDRFTNYNPVSYEGKAALLPSSQLGGSDIKPERQTEIEVGFDVSLLSRRLAMELTWYSQHISDLLLDRQIAPSTGFSTKLENVGEMDNTGLELLVRAIPLDNPGLRWSTTVTFGTNKNEVSGIEGDIRVLSGTWGLAAAINGEPLGVYRGWGYERDDDGNIMATDGEIYTDKKTQIPARSSDRIILGDPNPEFTASWINELSIGRSLSIRAQFDVIYGNDIWNYTRRIGAYGAYGTLEDYEKELKGEVAEGYGRAMWLNFERWVEDGSFIKLRELSVDYTIATNIMGLKALRVSFVGRNLFSIDSYTGYDPEVNAGAQRLGTRGYEFVEVPIPRSLSIGLTANF